MKAILIFSMFLVGLMSVLPAQSAQEKALCLGDNQSFGYGNVYRITCDRHISSEDQWLSLSGSESLKYVWSSDRELGLLKAASLGLSEPIQISVFDSARLRLPNTVDLFVADRAADYCVVLKSHLTRQQLGPSKLYGCKSGTKLQISSQEISAADSVMSNHGFTPVTTIQDTHAHRDVIIFARSPR